MLQIDPATVDAELLRRAGYKFSRYFPDCQPGCVADSPRREDHVNADGSQRLCRVLYPKQLAFFALGATYPERKFMAANRVGKTDAAVYEATCHLTGEYPHWWEGRRFVEAGEWWAAGDTTQTTRDILQLAFLGPVPHGRGTGMIPAHRIRHTSPGRMTLAVDSIWVEHVSGGVSSVQFKSYDQGRESFQGTAKQGCLLDEEPDEAIVAECLLRTMTTRGLMLYSFTPLSGLTPFVQQFIEGDDAAGIPSADFWTTDGLVPARTGFWGEHDPATGSAK